MLLDLNGNVVMHGHYIAHDLDEVLTPEDMIVWRCASCQTYLLPKEIIILRRRIKDTLNGIWTHEIAQICPVCHPNPNDVVDEQGDAHTDYFYKMSREEYHLMRKRESSKVIVAN